MSITYTPLCAYTESCLLVQWAAHNLLNETHVDSIASSKLIQRSTVCDFIMLMFCFCRTNGTTVVLKRWITYTPVVQSDKWNNRKTIRFQTIRQAKMMATCVGGASGRIQLTRGAAAAPLPFAAAGQNVRTALISRLTTALVPELLSSLQSHCHRYCNSFRAEMMFRTTLLHQKK